MGSTNLGAPLEMELIFYGTAITSITVMQTLQ